MAFRLRQAAWTRAKDNYGNLKLAGTGSFMTLETGEGVLLELGASRIVFTEVNRAPCLFLAVSMCALKYFFFCLAMAEW